MESFEYKVIHMIIAFQICHDNEKSKRIRKLFLLCIFFNFCFSKMRVQYILIRRKHMFTLLPGYSPQEKLYKGEIHYEQFTDTHGKLSELLRCSKMSG